MRPSRRKSSKRSAPKRLDVPSAGIVRRYKQLQRLCGAAREIAKLSSERETYQKIVDIPVKILGLDLVRLILVDKCDRGLYCVASSRKSEGRAERFEFLDERMQDARAALRRGRTIVRPPRRARANPARSGSGAAAYEQGTVYVPLMSHGIAFGLLVLRARPRLTWKNDEIELATHFSGLASVAIENAKLLNRLNETEERLRSLIDHIPAIVYTSEVIPPFDTIYVSPQVKHILGYSHREFLDQNGFILTIIHPDDRERVIDFTKEAVHKRGFATVEYRLRDLWGEYRWFRDEAVLVRDPADEPLAWHGVIVEITGLKKAQSRSLGTLAPAPDEGVTVQT